MGHYTDWIYSRCNSQRGVFYLKDIGQCSTIPPLFLLMLSWCWQSSSLLCIRKYLCLLHWSWKCPDFQSCLHTCLGPPSPGDRRRLQWCYRSGKGKERRKEEGKPRTGFESIGQMIKGRVRGAHLSQICQTVLYQQNWLIHWCWTVALALCH